MVRRLAKALDTTEEHLFSTLGLSLPQPSLTVNVFSKALQLAGKPVTLRELFSWCELRIDVELQGLDFAMRYFRCFKKADKKADNYRYRIESLLDRWKRTIQHGPPDELLLSEAKELHLAMLQYNVNPFAVRLLEDYFDCEQQILQRIRHLFNRELIVESHKSDFKLHQDLAAAVADFDFNETNRILRDRFKPRSLFTAVMDIPVKELQRSSTNLK